MNSILLVEDDRKIARVVKVYLEDAGYKVVHVEKGKDAISSALMRAVMRHHAGRFFLKRYANIGAPIIAVRIPIGSSVSMAVRAMRSTATR